MSFIDGFVVRRAVLPATEKNPNPFEGEGMAVFRRFPFAR